MNTIANLKYIVSKFNANTIINGLLGNRIYIGQPLTEQSQNYMTINIITQIQNIEVNNRTRVEFRYIGQENTAIDTLGDIEYEVKDFIIKKYKDLGFYKFEIGNIANGYDEKKRPVIIRDFILYYTT